MHDPTLICEHLCPICGYDLGEPAYPEHDVAHVTCSCCSFHFGYDDFCSANTVYATRLEAIRDWRRSWIASGMPWWFEEHRPSNWDPITQALRVFDLDLERFARNDPHAAIPGARIMRVPRRVQDYPWARVHRLRPGLIWLQHGEGWYLVEEVDWSSIWDDTIVEAIELIDHVNTVINPLLAHHTGLERLCQLIVRKVRARARGALFVYCDLLLHTTCSTQEEVEITTLAAHALTAFERRSWSQVIRIINPIRTRNRPAALYGERWFQRLLPADDLWGAASEHTV